MVYRSGRGEEWCGCRHNRHRRGCSSGGVSQALRTRCRKPPERSFGVRRTRAQAHVIHGRAGRHFVSESTEIAFLFGFVIPSAVVAVLATLIVVFARGRLSYRSAREPQPVDDASSEGTPLAHP